MDSKFRQTKVVILLLIILSLQIAASAARPVIIVKDHKSEYRILAGKNCIFAASELQKYIEKITSAKLTIIDKADSHPYIALGNEFLAEAYHQEIPCEWDDSFIIKFSGKNIFIGGVLPRGTLFGVYDFLENLGCRWYSPSMEALLPFSEKIPVQKDLRIEPCEKIFRPFMKYRKRDADAGSRTFSDSTWPAVIDWAAKNKTNIIAVGIKGFERNKNIILEEVRKRDLILMVGQHDIMDVFLPSEEYFPDHPEWFGYINGERVTKARGRRVVFETASDEAMRKFSGNLIQYLRDNPAIDVFQLWPPDVAYWSESEASESIGSAAERMALLVQQISKDILNAGLNTRISFLAYSFYTDPPSNMAFDKKTLVEFCPIDQDFRYPLSDPSSKVNGSYHQQITKWADHFPGDIVHYSYYAKYSWRSLPVVLPLQIAQEVQNWRKNGEKGTSLYFEPGNWLALEINHIAFSKASSDSLFNAGKWYSDYLKERFGKASGHMKKYFSLATRISLEALIPQSSTVNIDPQFALLKEADKELSRALRISDTGESSWLIRRLRWQSGYLELALCLRKAEIEKNPEEEDKYRKMISELILRHTGEGTTLDRGYGYKVSMLPD